MSAELKIIPTITETTLVGSAISIKTSYLEDVLPNTLLASIADSVGSQDSIPFIEGELLIKMKNSPAQIDYSIDSNGHLILITNTNDAGNYSVDANGHLIYTS